MGEVYNRYVDTVGNLHWSDVETGEHCVKADTDSKTLYITEGVRDMETLRNKFTNEEIDLESLKRFATTQKVESFKNEPRETAKMVLENLDEILNELSFQVNSIETAIVTGPLCKDDGGSNANKHPDETMLQTLDRQRNFAETILKTVMRIREALW